MEQGNPPAGAAAGDRLRVAAVRVQDFRLLRDLCVELGRLTVLVGRNNAGKTSFLHALDVAFGGARPTEDDLHLRADQVRASAFVIDVKISPAQGEEFDEPIVGRLGQAIQLPADGGAQFFTVRTTGQVSADGSGIGIERQFLQGFACERDVAMALPVLAERPRREQLQLVAFFLLDARRDLVDELRIRTSHWGRVVAELGIGDAIRQEVEHALGQLGERIVAESSVLASLRDDLKGVTRALGSIVTDVAVAPLPGRLAEVGRAIDVVVGAPESAALPMRFQGMGTRSLAAVMTFHAFTKVRLGAAQDVPPLSLAAFEEPEAHLHPQAQRAMFDLIATLPGQRIISTHSPYVTRVADLADLRHLWRDGASVGCAFVDTAAFAPDALAKVRRFVQRQNGEVFFAQLVVLFEGETEDGALPILAQAEWGVDPSGRCVSLVRVDGAQNFQHFVPILEALRIPWLIFADGDAKGVQGVEQAGNALGRALDAGSPEVVMLPAGMDFEAYLVGEGFRAELEAAIAECFGPNEVAGYKKRSAGQPSGDKTPRDYDSPGWQDRLVRDFLRTQKGLSGAAIGEAIAARKDGAGRPVLPVTVRELLQRADKILKGSP